MGLVSYEFAAFLAVLVVLYYGIPGRFQWMVLLAFSYLFYACGGGFYLLYPLFTTVTTWFLARAIGAVTRQSRDWIKEHNPDREEKKEYNRRIKAKQRRIMAIGLILNFGILAVLKYFNFFLENVSLLLPLGISYYTFQSMGYLIDVYYRKYEPEKNPARFALFVSFFPQLVAGPISRYDQMKHSLYAAHGFQPENVRAGLQRMVWGYFKKLVIADRLRPAVMAVIRSPEIYDGIYVLLGMVGYTIWMYADFAGGMDIVLGTARLLGIRLPENFDRPFISRSLGEFWRRWHMTLMMWLREYLFFPVSTSRFSRKAAKLAGKIFGQKAAGKVSVYLATLTVWFVAGIWHGASWNFVAWGMANGVVLLISQELTGCFRRLRSVFSFTTAKAYGMFQIVRTFFLFAFLELFEYYSFGTVFVMVGSLFTSSSLKQLWDGRFGTLGLSRADLGILAVGVAFMIASGVMQAEDGAGKRMEKRPVLVQYGLMFGLFLLVVVTGVYGHGYDASQFIYNQF